MIKEQLVEAYQHIKIENKLSYSNMQQITKLNKTQLTLIICHKGEGISIDRMVEGLLNAGITTSINFHREELDNVVEG